MEWTMLCYDGTEYTLPTPVAWRLNYGLGTPCDSVWVKTLWSAGQESRLADGTRLRVTEKGETLFFGVIDECETQWSPAGCVAEITGRGLQALLLDNHKKMQISANHLLSLINDVLQMSKLEEGTTVLTHERISLVELTRDIITIIIGRAEEAGIEWEYEKDKSIIPYPYIYGSPLHLRQIFLNIYSNCIKYNRPGGKITTHTDLLGEQDGKCTYRWTISDTGIGMSPDFVDHIFEPFTQEKQDARSYYHGTGLGMTITKELVDRMGGSITVTSQLGVGSTFVITLPFEIAPSPEQTPDAHAALDISIAGCRLLLVEDNALNAEIAQILLTDEGATVTVVTDGKQAVEIVQNNPPDTFDAVLMDVMMPVMNGIDAAKTIRSLNRPDAKTLPIIAMTANAFYEDAQKCLAAGMNAHLAKPLQIKKVKQTIAEWVKNNRTAKKDA